MRTWRWLVVLVLVGIGMFLWGRCPGDPYNPNQPPEIADEEETIDLVEDTDEAGSWSITEGRAPVVRQGRAPAKKKEATATEKFAKAVITPDSITLLPQVRTWRDGDRGGLAVVDSRRDWQTREFDCPEKRRWEAGTTADGTDFYGNCERALPALLPKIGKTALTCGAVAAGAYGIAYLADYDKPGLAAGVGGGACVIVRVF